MTQPSGIRPTRIRFLLMLTLGAVLGGMALAWVTDQVFNRAFPVPWLAPLTLVVCALALLGWTLELRRRLRYWQERFKQIQQGTRPQQQHNPAHEPKPVPALLAARSAALGMASSRTGALVGGFYLGAIVVLLRRWEVPFIQERVWAALVAVLAGFALAGVGVWLERICRLPDEPTGMAARKLGPEPHSDTALS